MRDVIILGSINMDVVGFCDSHPAVGATVLGRRVAFFPGGKGANQAVAAARCLGRSKLLGCVGKDAFGEQMLAYLRAHAVDVSSVEVLETASTGVALVTVDSSGQNTIVVVPGANDSAKVPDHLPTKQISSPIVLAQFETPALETLRLFERTRAIEGTTILNPSPFRQPDEALLEATSVVIVNEHEFGLMIGKPTPDTPADVIGAALAAKRRRTSFVITLGSQGVVLAEDGEAPLHIPGHRVTAVDTTGAGDCFAGWFAAALAEHCSFEEAARRSNAAAAVSVTREGAGASMPARNEVDAMLRA